MAYKSVKCIFCRKAVETDGRMNWWHVVTGDPQCELFAAPSFVDYGKEAN